MSITVDQNSCWPKLITVPKHNGIFYVFCQFCQYWCQPVFTKKRFFFKPWWRYQMETFSASLVLSTLLALCSFSMAFIISATRSVCYGENRTTSLAASSLHTPHRDSNPVPPPVPSSPDIPHETLQTHEAVTSGTDDSANDYTRRLDRKIVCNMLTQRSFHV